jgi:hypothetical protein
MRWSGYTKGGRRSRRVEASPNSKRHALHRLGNPSHNSNAPLSFPAFTCTVPIISHTCWHRKRVKQYKVYDPMRSRFYFLFKIKYRYTIGRSASGINGFEFKIVIKTPKSL